MHDVVGEMCWNILQLHSMSEFLEVSHLLCLGLYLGMILIKIQLLYQSNSGERNEVHPGYIAGMRPQVKIYLGSSKCHYAVVVWHRAGTHELRQLRVIIISAILIIGENRKQMYKTQQCDNNDSLVLFLFIVACSTIALAPYIYCKWYCEWHLCSSLQDIVCKHCGESEAVFCSIETIVVIWNHLSMTCIILPCTDGETLSIIIQNRLLSYHIW